VRMIDFITSRKRNYQTTFGSEIGGRVFRDIVRFAKTGETFYHEDPHVRGMIEGRREVVYRIADHLNLSPDELLAKYHKGVTDE
jgi:hypothetical protein